MGVLLRRPRCRDFAVRSEETPDVTMLYGMKLGVPTALSEAPVDCD
jgi:hypothetical protein